MGYLFYNIHLVAYLLTCSPAVHRGPRMRPGVPQQSVGWRLCWQERLRGMDEWQVTGHRHCSAVDTASQRRLDVATPRQASPRLLPWFSRRTSPAVPTSRLRVGSPTRTGRGPKIWAGRERWSRQSRTSWFRCSRHPTTFAHTPPGNYHNQHAAALFITRKHRHQTQTNTDSALTLLAGQQKGHPAY